MLQLPCNQKLMKEQDGLKQESVMMMSNKEAKTLPPPHSPNTLDILHLQTEWNYR